MNNNINAMKTLEKKLGKYKQRNIILNNVNDFKNNEGYSISFELNSNYNCLMNSNNRNE